MRTTTLLRSLVLATGFVAASSAAHAAVHVFVNAGVYGPPVYAEGYVPPCPGDGYRWAPAYYDAYGAYVPGRWLADREWREHEWREHEWREHEWREHHGWGGEGYGYRDGWRDRGEWRHRDDD